MILLCLLASPLVDARTNPLEEDHGDLAVAGLTATHPDVNGMVTLTLNYEVILGTSHFAPPVTLQVFRNNVIQVVVP